jgi:LmbE family N-acetylglucosaminyl deacetylase
VGYTLVSFHAHPDDEALFTGGTLARAAAEGHRVILVVATAGEAGLAATALTDDGGLAVRRTAELERSAAALGCHQVHLLGYDDSGLDGRAGRAGWAFAHVSVDAAAKRLAAILSETGADVLTVYDSAGGYGHPDHRQIHRVGVRAAHLAGTPVVLEATVDRRALLRGLRVLRALRLAPPSWDPAKFADRYTPPELITHRIDIRRYASQKRAAMAAHATQATTTSGTRTLSAFFKLPFLVYRRVFGYEWFVERGRRPLGARLDDIFATLRRDQGAGDGYRH